MLRRREFVAAAPLALAACSQKGPAAEPPRVSILRATDYGSQLYDTVRRALAAHQLDVRGKRVLLKPNLVEFDPAGPINTDPRFVHAAFEAFRALGAAEVLIGEGPGHRRNTFELAEAAGYFQLFPDFERVFTDLNTDAVTRVRLAHAASKLAELYLPRTVLAADLLVSIPKMKTHHWVAATLSLKNLFGVVPGAVYGWPKNVLHWAGIHESIADLHRALPQTFALVDGIVGMEGNGPIQGRAKHAGVIVCGPKAPAVDATCCRIMGIDPAKVEYLRIFAGGRFGEQDVRLIAEPLASVRTQFELIPEFASLRL